MTTIRRFSVPAFVLLAFVALARADEPLRVVESGLLDEMKIYTATPPGATAVVVRRFDASRADLGTGAEGGKETRVAAVRTIQASGPQLLAASLAAKLAALGTFKSVREDDGSPIDEGTLVVEGRFTKIDPGSKAKRYWVGFGAGHSGTEVEGTVKDAAGNLFAGFKQERIAVIGAFGGDYVAKMTSDCRDIGEDVAVFLDAWATGKPLKKNEKKGKKGKKGN